MRVTHIQQLKIPPDLMSNRVHLFSLCACVCLCLPCPCEHFHLYLHEFILLFLGQKKNTTTHSFLCSDIRCPHPSRTLTPRLTYFRKIFLRRQIHWRNISALICPCRSASLGLPTGDSFAKQIKSDQTPGNQNVNVFGLAITFFPPAGPARLPGGNLYSSEAAFKLDLGGI